MQAQYTSNPARHRIRRAVMALIALVVLFIALLMWWWDTEPPLFDPAAVTRTQLQELKHPVSVGATTTATLIASVHTLLDKRGGYLSNDKLPPGVFMDNMPNWEFGSLTASRDLVRAAQRFQPLADAVDRGQGSGRGRSTAVQSERSLAAAQFGRPVRQGDWPSGRLS